MRKPGGESKQSKSQKQVDASKSQGERSLESFGVAGVLGKDAHIFYQVLFSTRNIGRISDLIFSKIKSSQVSEGRFRTALILGVIQGYQSQSTLETPQGQTSGDQKKDQDAVEMSMIDDSLDEPIALECGVDQEKVGIGIVFNLGPKKLINTEGLTDRVTQRKPQGSFEELLLQLNDISDRVYVRFQPEVRKIEMVSVIRLTTAALEKPLEKEAIRFFVMDQSHIEQTPQPLMYSELGDLEFSQLIRMDERENHVRSFKVEDRRIKGSTEVVQDVVRIGGSQDDLFNQDIFRVGGSNEFDSASSIRTPDPDLDASPAAGVARKTGRALRNLLGRVFGVRSSSGAKKKKLTQDIFHVRGPSFDVHDEEKLVIAGGDGEEQNARDPMRVLAARDLALSLPGEIVTDDSVMSSDLPLGEDAVADSNPVVSSPEMIGTPGVSTRTFTKTLTGVPSIPGVGGTEVGLGTGIGPEIGTAIGAAIEAGTDGVPVVPGAQEPSETDLPEVASEKLLYEIQEGEFNRLINVAQTQVNELDEFKNKKAKAMMESVIRKLSFEQMRLLEISQKVNHSIKVKELEFTNKINTLESQVKKSEVLLQQKDHALERTKEQIHNINQKMQKMKEDAGATRDDGGYLQKYNFSQKMLVQTREEKAQLVHKIGELRGLLNEANTTIRAKAQGPSSSEFATLQTNYARSVKQVDEFKKANRQLLDRLEQTKRGNKEGAGKEDSARKMEMALKLASSMKKESEVMKVEVQGLHRKELEMKKEIERLKSELAQRNQKAA